MNNTISADEVADRADDTYVLDVRPAYSFREEHIACSHNLPIYDQLSGDNFIGLAASLQDLPADREIAVVCFSGSKAERAATYLRERGYDAKRLAGGIDGWPHATHGTVGTHGGAEPACD